jgi:signal transduction histidine kinase
MATVAAPRPGAERARPQVLIVVGVGALGAIAAAATAFRAGYGPLDELDGTALARGLAVALYVWVGAYNFWRQPHNRFGLYLSGAGLLFALAAITDSTDELLHSTGRVVFALFVVFLAYVLLCFPHDRLGSRNERRVIAGLAAASGFLWLLALPLVERLPPAGPLTSCDTACPANAFRLVSTPEAFSTTLGNAITGVTAAGLLAVAGVLLQKAWSPAHLRRRLVVPVLCCAAVLAVNYTAFTILYEAGVRQLEAFKVVGTLTGLGLPVAMLIGQLRGSVFAATSLGQIVAQVSGDPVTPAQIELLLRDALGDPSLTLALRNGALDDYVDVDGRPVELPVDRGEMGVTEISREGQPVAALIHDAALEESGATTEGLLAASLMLLDHTNLVEELRSSRARILASAQRERLRLERNLHDGAQARLFAIQVKLAAARERAGDEQLAQELDELEADAAAAADDLRTLAHGLYPTVLRERGLVDGLRSVVRGAATPVALVDQGVPRCDANVEEAVYFCVLEAIQNATKHAGRGAHITVTLERRGADLEFAIADDGVGFDQHQHSGGIGLASMRDRIGAVGGTVDFISQPGRGTTVRGVVPAWL